MLQLPKYPWQNRRLTFGQRVWAFIKYEAKAMTLEGNERPRRAGDPRRPLK